MEIRKKLTYQISAAISLILLITFVAIYFSFLESRKAEFYDRLARKSKLVGQMLVDIEEIDLTILSKIEENNPLNLYNEKIHLYDIKDREIFTNDLDTTLNISSRLIKKVRAERQVNFRQGDYEVCGVLYSSKGVKLVVFTGAMDTLGKRKLTMLGNILLVTFFFSLVFIFLMGRILADRALRPIGKLIKSVDEISISNLDARVSEGNGKDEIARLAITFNNMLKRLETSFKIQKTFIANASHELRNPLTVLTGQMEVVLMSSRTKSEYYNTLKSAYEDAISINQLANSLLLLAQTSLESTSEKFEKIRIDDILWQSTHEMMNKYPDFQITTNFSENIIDDDHLTISGNEILLKAAIMNLLENSYKYSEKPEVQILVDLNTDTLILTFRDNGIGIPEKEIGMIFNPFFRSSNSIHKKGHGLGLALVQNIAHMHHGYITVASALNKGTTFALHLPWLLY
jgi:signal transduction histidine kinase